MGGPGPEVRRSVQLTSVSNLRTRGAELVFCIGQVSETSGADVQAEHFNTHLASSAGPVECSQGSVAIYLIFSSRKAMQTAKAIAQGMLSGPR